MARTILVIEDGDTAAPLEIALAALDGMKVVILPNGREALRLISSNGVDLAAVITDLHLPQVDGFELIQALRDDARYARMPIIVISGDTNPDTPARVRILGADAFFEKPYSPAEIRHTLEGLLYAR